MPGRGSPAWWIYQPEIDLHIEDIPSGYEPARGLAINFHLSYRQRGAVPEDPSIFSVGTNWSFSLRSYLLDLTSVVELHTGAGGWTEYTPGVPQYFDGSILTAITGGYQIEYRDGRKDTFTQYFTTATISEPLYFVTSQADPAGNTNSYSYTVTSSQITLNSVSDPDGNATHLYYENTSFPNQITKVVDPYLRTNLLTFDDLGYITNLVDVAGLVSSFAYDATSGRRGWITNMITPYGTTGFRYGGVDEDNDTMHQAGVNRFAEVTLPTGGKHLYLYRYDCSSFMPAQYSAVPSTSPLANTLDNVDQNLRNSFHWDPLQYGHLSTTDPTSLTSSDYAIGYLYHWLLLAPNTTSLAESLSLERPPSQDGSANWEYIFYDYDGKPSGFNNCIGTDGLPSFTALVLPDGSTRFTHYSRGGHSQITQTIQTYSKLDGTVGLRTNSLYYAGNNVDLLQWVGPNSEQVVSNYFSAGNVYHQPDASYDALSQETLYTYNGNRLLIKTHRPTGLTTTNIFLASGAAINRLQTTIDLEISRTNNYTWANGLVDSHTDERGLNTTNFWDALQRLIGVRFPDGTTTSNRYTFLDLTAVKDRSTNWSYAGFNSLRQKVAETNANGVVTRYGYCDCGALFAKTNAWNTPVQFVITYGYDYQGNRTYTYLPDATITNWYNVLAQAIQTADGAAVRYFSYNNQGQRTNTSNAFGTEQGTTFDIENRPLYVTDANGVTVTNSFDLLGRVRTRTYPDSGLESFGYSAAGLTAYTNQIGQTNFYVYDAAARRIFETNANHELIRYTNNAAGDLLSLTDGKSQTTIWHYDEYGRVTNKLDQSGAEVLRYKYDPDSRLTNRWSAAKLATTYIYDPVGNLTNVVYPNSPSVKLHYDPLNRVTNMVDAVGTTVYSYTAGGELFTEDGPFANDTVTNTYVNRLRTALALQQPTGAWTNGFAYDAAARLTNVTSQAGTFSYFLGGSSAASPLPKKLLLANSSYISNSYDSSARLLSTALTNSGGTRLDSYAYIYNPANQRTNLARADGSKVAYTYDHISQLTAADSSVNSEDRSYAYDSAWNLTSRTDNSGSPTFSYNSLNELINFTTNFVAQSCTYDLNGNLTQVGDPNAGTLIVFSYDDENRLTEVYTNNNPPAFGPLINGTVAWRSDFVYDGLGRLRKRLEYVNEVLSSTTLYIYDGKRVIQERDTNSTPTVSYTRGTDLSGSLEGAGGIGGLLSRSSGYSSGNWTTHHFYFADGNGNITYLSDSSQGLAANYRYDPFGRLISSSGTLASANVYRFSSKEVHPNTGMYYYLYRFYAPDLQRWINRDPFNERGFSKIRRETGRRGPVSHNDNLYVFVVNEPEFQVDPLGLFEFKNCEPEQVSTLQNAFKTGCKEAREKGCFKCLSKDAQDNFNKACDNGGAGITIECVPKGDDRCTGYCGRTPPPPGKDSGFGDTILICPSAWDPASGCGGPFCTLMHEATHAAGKEEHPKPQEVEKCLGCP